MAVTVVQPEEEIEEQDAYDAAFTESLSSDAVDDLVEEPAQEVAEVVEPTEPAQEEVEEVAEVVEPSEAEPEEVVETVEEEPQNLTMAQMKEMLAAQQAEFAKQLEGLKPKPEPEKEEPKPALSEEENKDIEYLKTEWPEQHKAVSAMLSQHMQSVGDLVKQAVSELKSEITPTLQSAQHSAQQTEIQMIETAHPDARQIAADLDTWIGKQPEYLRPAYSHVMAKGTPQEVIDVITQYKSTLAPQAPARRAPPQRTPQQAQRLAQMTEPSTSATTSISEGVDANNFDGAWDAAVS